MLPERVLVPQYHWLLRCIRARLLCRGGGQEKTIHRHFWGFDVKFGQYEGVSGLWRGLGLTLIMSIPSNVVYFIGYEHLRDNMPFQSQILTPLISGSLARTISATVVSPLELIKTRLQSVSSTSRHKALNDVIKGMRDMVKSQGILSLWRGLVLTLWRDVPFSGIYWMSVEAIKSRLSKAEYFQYHPEHRFLETLIAGSVGGTIASILTAPFDVGKTRRGSCIIYVKQHGNVQII